MSFTQKIDYDGNVTLSKFYSFSYHYISSAQPSSPRGKIISSLSQNAPKGYIDITSTCSLISLNLVKSHDLEGLVKRSWDQRSPTLKESSRVKKRQLLSLKSRFHSGKRQPFFNSKSIVSKRTKRKSEEYWINLENNSIFYKSDHEDQEHDGNKESNELRNGGAEAHRGGKNDTQILTLLDKHKNLEIVGTLYVRVLIGPEEEEEEWEPLYMVVVKNMDELGVGELDNIPGSEMAEFRLGTDYLQDIDVDNICYSYLPKLLFENGVSISLFDVKKADAVSGKGYGNIERSSESSNSESEEELNSVNSNAIKIKSETKDDLNIVDTENFAKPEKPDQIITRSNSLSQSPITTSTVVKNEEESQPDSPQNLIDPREGPLEENREDLSRSPLTISSSFEISNGSYNAEEPKPAKPTIQPDKKIFESETPNNTNYSHAVIIQPNWVGMPLAIVMHHLLSNVSTSNKFLISSIGVQQPIMDAYKFPRETVGTQTCFSNEGARLQVSQSTVSTQTTTIMDGPVAMPQSQALKVSQSTQTLPQPSRSTQTLKVSQTSQSIQTSEVSQLSKECQTRSSDMVSVKVQASPVTPIFSPPPEVSEASNSTQRKEFEVKKKAEKTKHQE
ncbi:4342_t:CDS:2 [Acaulospora colombiana]|uniref:4342_t:CDS:1 n=1 Tax=Acaulospora colombiana TaxID=27376 RepID=A0ACA9LPI9_9GLOM|nr:4342_t:CDS:2 [Acaulospora colombiana]